jgi:hypothetical protein
MCSVCLIPNTVLEYGHSSIVTLATPNICILSSAILRHIYKVLWFVFQVEVKHYSKHTGDSEWDHLNTFVITKLAWKTCEQTLYISCVRWGQPASYCLFCFFKCFLEKVSQVLWYLIKCTIKIILITPWFNSTQTLAVWLKQHCAKITYLNFNTGAYCDRWENTIW